MVDRDWFDDLSDDFEESVRIDRNERDHRERAIQSYHMTADSRRFIQDFVDRMLDRADDMRTGSNYWLYGYYGSGKSHLLTVLDGLLDTDWLEGKQDTVWSDLAGDTRDETLDQLRDHWREIHEEYYVIPISVNLLKYQGQKQRSFSEIVLRHAHRDPDLTGVSDDISRGLSSQLDVAYFEKWFRTTEAWPERQDRAEAVLEGTTGSSRGYDWETDGLWKDIQQYGALADVVLPRLFEDVNGTIDGYADLKPSAIDAEETVSRLEKLRAEREKEHNQPVKLVLLLDEVSLFIGTDYGRLTELQSLAEKVDEIADDDIQLVVTAQANIEDTQPGFAAHGADFSILKDRFPHRYQLPSKHVGDIAKRRLFEKSESGERAVRDILEEASVKPAESLVYNDIKQNTKPPLDSIDEATLVEFYPFLPYHAPIFLEILFNLRQEASDPAKSIFSGTARAILALMHNLLQSWIEEDEPDHVISLVDLYEQIEPELREILTQDMRVIEGTRSGGDDDEVLVENEAVDELDASRGIADEVRDGELEPFDLKVAKAVLLLQHVHDIVPLDEGNIAVSVMSDLNGRSWISTQNRVEESLDRLQKFIRPNEDESGARYRFATQEERLIYDEAEDNERNPDWDAVLDTLDEHLWGRITQDLSLPDSVPYGDSGEEYPVTYGFGIDGTEFETTVDAEGGLDVSIEIRGVRPDATADNGDGETLYWSIDTDGLDDLRKHLVRWWALRDAISTHTTPPAVERDLSRRASTVRSKLVSAMGGGSYTVKDRTDIGGLSKAVQTAVDLGYPDDFHPMMLQVTDDRLQELAELSPDDPLPAWAHTIQVPSSDPSASQGKKTIQSNVMALTGRQLKDRDDGLNLNTVLDGIVSKKPFYDETRPALCAIIWGFCREGRLVPVDEDGNTLENEAVLDQDTLSTTRLKLLPREPIGNLLEDGGFKETTETVADGLINLQEANQRLRSSLTGLREDVQLVVATDVHSDAVSGLLDSFIEALSDRIDATSDRLTVVRSQGDGLGAAIEQTNEAQEWFDEVRDVWNRRLESLYRFDAQLTAADARFEWIDEDVQSSAASQREALESFQGDWWTTDGWKALVGTTTTGLDEGIQELWDIYVAAQGIPDLVGRVAEHPWVIPATELPAGVQRAFERTYITPYRELRQWYETIDEAMSSLSADDEDTLVSAADNFAGAEPLAEAIDHDVEELDSRLDRLTEIVDDRTPDDVDQIGMLPDDRQTIQKRLERLVEERDLDIETTDSGVIVR
ncbi:hypothetical protein [Haloplanus aerogenes]|uniref:BREX system P-loop protein BrxC n=1 Tax=Haloplanus aerogenes TaxID=660522 RepID=A0A3M0CXZ0_9EURY|nr:hypothetical protein [Haloplanus aerogenes]AZH24849.1 hypothetical protein DU502_05450 [Haloplanus aerogenes]RMB13948.1 hypothetical protein ATH50_2392 [Haloplanus aerogenes]